MFVVYYTLADADRGLLDKKFLKGRVVASNIVSAHVDDLISAASPNVQGTALSMEFWKPSWINVAGDQAA